MQDPLIIVHRSLEPYPAQRHTPPPPRTPQRHPPQPPALLYGFPHFPGSPTESEEPGKTPPCDPRGQK